MRKASRQRKRISRRRTLAVSLLINLAMLAIMLMLFYPKYDNRADVVMQSLLYGTIPGLQMAHIVFSNVILGKILSVLIGLAPGVPWYTVAQYLFVFAALTSIGYVVLRRAGGAVGKAVLVLVLCFLSYEGYVTVNYMRTACLLTASGTLLFMHALLVGRRRVCTETVVAAALVIAGSMVSFTAFRYAFAIGLLSGVVYAIVHGRPELLRHVAIGMGVVALLAVGLYGADCLSYRNNKNYEHTLEYREDYERLYANAVNRSYDAYTRIYGINNDKQYNAVSWGVFLNGKTEEPLMAIREIANRTQEPSIDMVDSFFKRVPLSVFTVDCFYLLFGVTVVLLAFSKRRWRILLPVLAVVLLGLFFMDARYFRSSGEAYFILFVTTAVQLLLYTSEMKTADWKPIVAFAMVFFVVLYSRFSGGLYTGVNKNPMDKAFEDLDSGPYFIDLNTYCVRLSAFTRYPSDLIPDNVYIVNGFYSTMTVYDPDVIEINWEEGDSRWAANPGGFSVNDFVDFRPRD